MRIERSSPDTADELTRIAFAAKRYWGYPENWIQRWSELLTITPDYIRLRPTYSALHEHGIVGFCAVELEPYRALLAHLWVDPQFMGQGIGRALFHQAECSARESGARHLEIESDPFAEAFYRKMGAFVYGAKPAMMDHQMRFLPLLRKAL